MAKIIQYYILNKTYLYSSLGMYLHFGSNKWCHRNSQRMKFHFLTGNICLRLSYAF